MKGEIYISRIVLNRPAKWSNVDKTIRTRPVEVVLAHKRAGLARDPIPILRLIRVHKADGIGYHLVSGKVHVVAKAPCVIFITDLFQWPVCPVESECMKTDRYC